MRRPCNRRETLLASSVPWPANNALVIADPTIPDALNRLGAGGLVAFPTETVYGLGADAFNAAAVQLVFDVKGRPSNNPLIVHVADAAMARTVVAHWPDSAQRLADAFWPGPLSIVLPKADEIPAIVTAHGPNVAVRCPDHPRTLELLRQFGPLVGPSANLSGRISPTAAQHVRDSFTHEQVLILDGGPCRAGIESTVLSLASQHPRVLRPGVISIEQIQAVLGGEVSPASTEHANHAPGSTPLESPGMLDTHYAPLATAIMFGHLDLSQISIPGPIVVLGPTWASATGPLIHRIEMPTTASAYAARLYAALREADAREPELIVVIRPEIFSQDPQNPVWLAVMDRLRRATVGDNSGDSQ